MTRHQQATHTDGSESEGTWSAPTPPDHEGTASPLPILSGPNFGHTMPGTNAGHALPAPISPGPNLGVGHSSPGLPGMPGQNIGHALPAPDYGYALYQTYQWAQNNQMPLQNYQMPRSMEAHVDCNGVYEVDSAQPLGPPGYHGLPYVVPEQHGPSMQVSPVETDHWRRFDSIAGQGSIFMHPGQGLAQAPGKDQAMDQAMAPGQYQGMWM